MVAYPRIRLNAAIAPVGGLVAAVLVALVFVFLPQDMLEDWTWNSGIAALIPVAQPPLGITARAILAIGFGGIAAAIVWSALYLLFGPGGMLAPRAPAEDGVPVLRRADSHPDAPARRPISAAADLGDPVLPPVPPLVRDLPDDLDQPLAAYDPHAILPAPREPIRPVTPLTAKPVAVEPPPTLPVESSPPLPVESTPTATPPVESPDPAQPLRIDADTRSDTLVTPRPAPIAPPVPPVAASEPASPLRIEPRIDPRPETPSAPLPVPSAPAAGAPSPAAPADEAQPSIEMLLARLERGARRRSDAPRPTIDDALGTLRGINR